MNREILFRGKRKDNGEWVYGGYMKNKNGIKTDNRVCNLEWATHKEQKEHQIKNGLCINNINSLKKANEKKAIPIFYNGVKYNSIREASRKLGVCQWNIKKNGEIINE